MDAGVDRTQDLANAVPNANVVPARKLQGLRVVRRWPGSASLRRCAEAAGSASRLVILESVKPEAKAFPLVIEMVLARGKLRSCDQFDLLGRTAGLRINSARGAVSGHFVVE